MTSSLALIIIELGNSRFDTAATAYYFHNKVTIDKDFAKPKVIKKAQTSYLGQSITEY